MISKLLIANRGEIAVRIARTARRMRIATVAVYSDADATALHVTSCDEAVRIGPAPAAESYLRIDRIIAAARDTGANAIHPGYGFLAENAGLAEACAAVGIVFVGPSPAAMRMLGDKAAAKALADSIRVPVVPGYAGEGQGIATFKKEAKRIGLPLMVKAAAGGGGRGMRAVVHMDELAAAIEAARREAEAAFGDGRLLLERLIERPRHVEVQVFADRHGNVVHLFERECSLQRRHQKVIEEAPAPGMSEGLRERLCDAAVRLARAARYEGAGTVEFLIEGGALGPDAPFYFIEANTRLQVEHPVTEAITGLDLVQWQLRVASGEPLPLRQDQIRRVSGTASAIELRVCAEDPAHGFRPSTGRLIAFAHDARDPETRLETGVREGDEVTPFYDSMIAKLIVAAPSRAEAVASARAELARLQVAGPRTNLRFLANLLDDADVRSGRLDTGLIDRKPELMDAVVSIDALRLGAGQLLSGRAHRQEAASGQRDRSEPWQSDDAFQLGPSRSVTYTLDVDGRLMRALASWSAAHGFDIIFPDLAADVPRESGAFHCVADGAVVIVLEDGAQARISWPSDSVETLHPGEAGDVVRAPITGRVAAVMVEPGASVAKGDRVAVVEAMKMEHVLHAPRDGVVARLAVRAGDQIAEGALVAEIADAPSAG